MKSTKGQLKIQEMSFMILGLILLFILVGLFFITISNANLKKSYQSLSKDKAISVIEQLSKMPEFSCGNSISMCIDTDKLLVLKDNPNFKNYWEIDGGLIVKKIYPPGQNAECNLGNYQICNQYTLQPKIEGNYEEYTSLVLLCKKKSSNGYVNDKCEIGTVSAYVKRSLE